MLSLKAKSPVKFACFLKKGENIPQKSRSPIQNYTISFSVSENSSTEFSSSHL